MSGRGFVRATKELSRLRLALAGPGGSGKTFTALAIAKHLAPAGPVGLVDTEGRSSRKYSHVFDFSVLDLESFDPRAYTAAIHEAERAGMTTLILDSLSHAWMGTDGALEMKDRAAKRANGNSFVAWADVTPHHNAMLQAILRSPMNIIATLRTKTAYVLETNDRGKQVPRKVGLQPIQREGVEYEFDIFGEMTLDQVLVVGKTRCSALVGREFPHAGKLFADAVNTWLEDGAAPAAVAPAAPPPPPPPPSDAQLVHRDRKPDMLEAERALVDAFTPQLTSAKTYPELDLVARRCAAAAGGRNSTPAFQAWHSEMVKQAEAALGPRPATALARTAPTGAPAPAGKAVAS